MRGRANRQLAAELAKVLGVSKTDVEVLSGHKISKKVVLVKGIAADQAILIIEKKLR